MSNFSFVASVALMILAMLMHAGGAVPSAVCLYALVALLCADDLITAVKKR